MGEAGHEPLHPGHQAGSYLRYYSSNRPLDDHGHRSLVLVVFDDYLAEGNFLGVARREMVRTGVEVPLWISHTGLMERVGPLGTGLAQPGRAGAESRVHSNPHSRSRENGEPQTGTWQSTVGEDS